MRVTKKAKEKTRATILAAAEKLFLRNGYEQTTTRDIASAAEIAAGTLFNYFPSKETLAMTMVADAMTKGGENYRKRRSGQESVEEDLFLLISSELRCLRPFRKFIGPVLESTMSLFSKSKSCPAGESARVEHLNTVKEIITADGACRIPDFIAISLYWSLYLGILAYWSKDRSRNQEETMAMIDYSLKVLTQAIGGNAGERGDRP
jgi:AcrR family transcriptional regulator